MNLKFQIENKFLKIWYQRNKLHYLLLPFTAVYWSIMQARRQLYRWGMLKSTQFSVPVIIVGNITVGGTGKTPSVIWLVEWLKAKGYKPGIVSRGYKGSGNHNPYFVTANTDPKIAGDEAVMLAQRNICPVVVGKHRVAAIEKLLTQHACNIIVADDGLQHYALNRDIEIAVVDGLRRLGNGFCLPAGPLRESASRLKQVDFVLVNGQPISNKEYSIHTIPKNIYNIKNPQKVMSIQDLKTQRVHVVAGIGNPDRFFQLLLEHQVAIIPHVFPDHYLFQKKDIDWSDPAIILMTEKDAVKCHHFCDERHWCVPIDVNMDPLFESTLAEKLKGIH